MKMNDNFTNTIRELYISGLSLEEISTKLQCSPHKVVYWMNKLQIPRRSRSVALYQKYNPTGDPFLIKSVTSPADALLLGLGIGIYWGEGNKVSPYAVRVTNTDPNMILTFRRFLIDICGIQREKIKYSIVCFNDSQTDLVAEYWSKILDISLEKFGKIVQVPPQGKGTYKRKSKFGVCTVAVYNTKFKQWMLSKIDEFSPG